MDTMWQIVISRGALEGTLSRLGRTIEKSPCNHPSELGLVRNTPKMAAVTWWKSTPGTLAPGCHHDSGHLENARMDPQALRD